jgi:hypothetical protein
LALIRRLSAEQRAARHLAARARSDKARALEAAARQEQLLRLAAENDFEEREDLGRLEQDGEQR